MPDLIQGTAVATALDANGPLAGALFLGPPGAGKSSLALGLIEGCPWRRSALVADDGVVLALAAGRLQASAPETIRGLIEVRGFGPVSVRTVPTVPLRAAFDLVVDAARLPEETKWTIAGGALLRWPLFAIDPLLAAVRVRVILRAIVARSATGGSGSRPD